MENKIKQLADTNGIDGVFIHTIQESAELIQAIGKLQDDITLKGLYDLFGEIADVEVMLAQLKYIIDQNMQICDFEHIIDSIKAKKIDRQLTRFGLK